MTNIAISPTDEALREHTLPVHECTQAEFAYAGYVRLIASGRYHARLDVQDEIWEFTVVQTGPNQRELTANYPEGTPPMLLNLAWHRAAEAMLAHRRGHAEANLRKELRRAQKRERQDD